MNDPAYTLKPVAFTPNQKMIIAPHNAQIVQPASFVAPSYYYNNQVSDNMTSQKAVYIAQGDGDISSFPLAERAQRKASFEAENYLPPERNKLFSSNRPLPSRDNESIPLPQKRGSNLYTRELSYYETYEPAPLEEERDTIPLPERKKNTSRLALSSPSQEDIPVPVVQASYDVRKRNVQTPSSDLIPKKRQNVKPLFRWPVRGRVVTRFGVHTDEQNDGIDISVPVGTHVQAAEDGLVIYAGDDLEGYGNLLLLRHEGGWVTAYAHNKSLHFKRGDSVLRGDVIAESGMTGHVVRPQVHFEIRHNNQPVDPLKYLPL